MKRSIICLVLCLTAMLALVAWGCTPQASGESNNASGGSSSAGSDKYAESFTWSADADCVACHTTEAESIGNSSTLVNYHSENEGVTCSVCHSDSTALAGVHSGKTSSSKMPIRLRSTKVTESTCFSCHDDYATLAQKTATSTALTDANGTVVNPHELPENSDHDIITCTSCHVMHKAESAEDASMAQCTSCHHEKVFECGTCHN